MSWATVFGYSHFCSQPSYILAPMIDTKNPNLGTLLQIFVGLHGAVHDSENVKQQTLREDIQSARPPIFNPPPPFLPLPPPTHTPPSQTKATYHLLHGAASPPSSSCQKGSPSAPAYKKKKKKKKNSPSYSSLCGTAISTYLLTCGCHPASSCR